MPRLAAAVYAAHQDNLLKLAAKDGGVSRQEIADALHISKAVASGLIKRCDLVRDHKKGKTEYFKTFKTNGASVEPETAPADKPADLPEVEAVAVAGPEIVDDEEDIIATLDAEIVDTRNALHSAASKAGKALGEWATHQALVDALRERMTGLAVKRMDASQLEDALRERMDASH